MNAVSDQPGGGFHRRALTVPLILTWAGRLAGLASILLLLAFMFGENGHGFNSRTLVLFAFFPCGVILGLALGWWRPALGGALALLSVPGFYLATLAMGGSLPRGLWFFVFASPGLLLLAGALMQQMTGRREVGTTPST
jgi:hypothetical protein